MLCFFTSVRTNVHCSSFMDGVSLTSLHPVPSLEHRRLVCVNLRLRCHCHASVWTRSIAGAVPTLCPTLTTNQTAEIQLQRPSCGVQQIASLGAPQNICHPRVMFRSLLHLTLITSKFSLTYLPVSLSPSQSSPLVHDPYKPCDDLRRSGGSTEVPSPTGYEPNMIESDD